MLLKDASIPANFAYLYPIEVSGRQIYQWMSKLRRGEIFWQQILKIGATEALVRFIKVFRR